MRSSCIDIEMLADIVSGNLTRKERSRVSRHLSQCESCFEKVVSASHIFKDDDLSSWEPLSEAETRQVMKGIENRRNAQSVNLRSAISGIKRWCREQGSFPLMTYGYARSASTDKAQSQIEYIHIEKVFDGLSAVIFLEKYKETFSMHIKLKDDPADIQNVRFNLISEGGFVSRLLKEGCTCFENLPFGDYHLLVVHKNIEKGKYNFNISTEGINDNQDAIS